MQFVPSFFLSVFGVAEELHHDVEVIADRRWRERRVAARPVEGERRRTDRRGRKEEILEIVIEGDPLSMFPTSSRS